MDQTVNQEETEKWEIQDFRENLVIKETKDIEDSMATQETTEHQVLMVDQAHQELTDGMGHQAKMATEETMVRMENQVQQEAEVKEDQKETGDLKGHLVKIYTSI